MVYVCCIFRWHFSFWYKFTVLQNPLNVSISVFHVFFYKGGGVSSLHPTNRPPEITTADPCRSPSHASPSCGRGSGAVRSRQRTFSMWLHVASAARAPAGMTPVSKAKKTTCFVFCLSKHFALFYFENGVMAWLCDCIARTCLWISYPVTIT